MLTNVTLTSTSTVTPSAPRPHLDGDRRKGAGEEGWSTAGPVLVSAGVRASRGGGGNVKTKVSPQLDRDRRARRARGPRRRRRLPHGRRAAALEGREDRRADRRPPDRAHGRRRRIREAGAVPRLRPLPVRERDARRHDMPGILLGLRHVADAEQGEADLGARRARRSRWRSATRPLPLSVTVTGNYRGITKFLGLAPPRRAAGRRSEASMSEAGCSTPTTSRSCRDRSGDQLKRHARRSPPSIYTGQVLARHASCRHDDRLDDDHDDDCERTLMARRVRPRPRFASGAPDRRRRARSGVPRHRRDPGAEAAEDDQGRLELLGAADVDRGLDHAGRTGLDHDDLGSGRRRGQRPRARASCTASRCFARGCASSPFPSRSVDLVDDDHGRSLAGGQGGLPLRLRRPPPRPPRTATTTRRCRPRPRRLRRRRPRPSPSPCRTVFPPPSSPSTARSSCSAPVPSSRQEAPLFRLAAIGKKGLKIGIVGGSFVDGAAVPRAPRRATR